MKRLTFIALLFAIGLTSCVKRDDNYNVQPVGYQFSFLDDFNNDQNQWSFGDNTNNAYVSISGGQLQYDYHPANSGTNTVAINTGMRADYNFLLQTRIRSDNAMGLVFGVSPSEYGYSFFIDAQGYFALFDEGSSTIQPQPILNWTQSSAIRTGWNDVALEQVGNTWVGYINGTQVFQTQARNLYGGQVGFMVLANTSGDADFLHVQW